MQLTNIYAAFFKGYEQNNEQNESFQNQNASYTFEALLCTITGIHVTIVGLESQSHEIFESNYWEYPIRTK
jgi:hypothetical protein